MRLEGLLPWANMICWQNGWERKEMKMTSRFWPQQLEKWDCHSLRQERLRLYGLKSWSGFGHLEFEWQLDFWVKLLIRHSARWDWNSGPDWDYISIEMVLKTSLDWEYQGNEQRQRRIDPKTESQGICVVIICLWYVSPPNEIMVLLGYFSYLFLLSTLYNIACISFA